MDKKMPLDRYPYMENNLKYRDRQYVTIDMFNSYVNITALTLKNLQNQLNNLVNTYTKIEDFNDFKTEIETTLSSITPKHIQITTSNIPETNSIEGYPYEQAFIAEGVSEKDFVAYFEVTEGVYTSPFKIETSENVVTFYGATQPTTNTTFHLYLIRGVV